MLKKRKSKANKPRYIKICPRCKSLDVKEYNARGLAAGLPSLYTCGNCGYTSHLFPEVDLNEKKRGKLKKVK